MKSLKYGFRNGKEFYAAYKAEMLLLIKAQEERAARKKAVKEVHDKAGEVGSEKGVEALG